MHASVRRYRVMDAEAFVKRTREEYVDRVNTIEGLVGYYMIDGGDGTVTSITVCETEEAVKRSDVSARHWVIERAAHLVAGAPEVTSGEVRVRVRVES
jgi:hypothetical protein